jgi:hypothetical protein
VFNRRRRANFALLCAVRAYLHFHSLATVGVTDIEQLKEDQITKSAAAQLILDRHSDTEERQ